MIKLVPALVFGVATMLTIPAFAQAAADGGNVASSSAPPASGPTPFPKDAKDWPGQGAIRVFPYMNDNRKYFWTQRGAWQGRVVFAGDSLVGGWTTLAKDLPGVPVANVGIGGEPTRGLLFRFREDVLDLHPKAIVLLTGSNDLSAQQDLQQTRANLVAMLDMAERASPGVPIVLCTVPPRDYADSPVDPKRVIELNKVIAAAAQGRPHVAVLDLHALLADANGMPQPEFFAADRGHLAPAGFKRFRDALVPVLKRFNIG